MAAERAVRRSRLPGEATGVRGRSTRRWRAPALVLVAVTILSGCTPAGSAAPSSATGRSSSAEPSRAAAPAETAGVSHPGGEPSDGGATPTGSVGAPTEFPPADVAAIRDAIDRINATAGGPIARQRAELKRLVVAAQAARQRSCPPASGTIGFEPAYPSLRRPAVGVPGQGDGATGPAAGSAHPSPAGRSGGPPTGVPSGSGAVGASGPSDGGAGTEYLLPAFITIYTGSRITGTDLTTLHLWVKDGLARTAALCVS